MVSILNTRNMFFIGLFAMALGLWFLAPFSWLKAKIDGNVQRKEAEWKREDKKTRNISAIKNVEEVLLKEIVNKSKSRKGC